MRDSHEIEQAMLTHGDSVWRICCTYFRNKADAEDAYQDTFLKFALADKKSFNEEEYKKAWLLRVAANTCKDMLRNYNYRNQSIDNEKAYQLLSTDSQNQPDSQISEIIDAIRRLDDPPRTPLYLALYEGYKAKDIAAMLNAPENTVYSWIARGKEKLREALK